MRRTGIASTALFAVLLLTFLGYWMGKATTSAKAEAPGQSSSAAAATSSNSSLMPVAPPGTAIYSAKRGESIPIIARHHLSKTSYLTSAELAAAIRSANNKGSANSVKAGDAIIIPGILDTPIVEKPIPVRSDFEVRALYLTGVMRVITDLKAKGVHGDVIEKAVSSAYEDVSEEGQARAYLRRKRLQKPTNQKEAARVFRSLMRAGFGSRTIFAILKKWEVDEETISALESEGSIAQDPEERG